MNFTMDSEQEETTDIGDMQRSSCNGYGLRQPGKKDQIPSKWASAA